MFAVRSRNPKKQIRLGLGFGAFSQVNPTITFIVADTGYLDNGNQFVLTQTPVTTSVPTLGEWGLMGLTLMLAGFGVMTLRRRPV